MADNLSGGTTASFNNTPQAKDDYYSYGEDVGIKIFDVMGNDLGGNAKSLWSIDNTSDDGSGDLVARDIVGACEYSELGARIWLTSDGKIAYDTSVFNSLAYGQTVTDQFTYAIRLSNGTLSWATVNVTMTGTNDGPDIFLAAGDSASAAIAETNSGLSASGTLSVVDPDTRDTIAVSIASVAVGGSGAAGAPTGSALLAMLSLGAGSGALAANAGSTGNLSWNFSSDGQAFNYLAAGETLVLTYTLTADDDHGGTDTQTVTITVTGTNDAPVAVADTAAVAEDASIDGSVATNDSDVDHNAVLAYALDDDAPAGLAFNADGSWTFDASSYDSLEAGEALVLTIPYTVTDEHGESAGANLTITVTGTNDAPTVSGALTATSAEGAGATTLNLLAGASDADSGETATLTIGTVSYSVNGGTSSTIAPAGLSLTGSTLSVDPTDAAFDSLAVGQSMVIVLSYNVVDAQGAPVAQTQTVTITGTNDAGDPNDNDGLVTSTVKVTMASGANGSQNPILGSTQADTLYGGLGNDKLYGGAGDDFIYGNAPGAETNAEDGDTIYGGSGNDSIFGNQRNDIIYGGSGSDTIRGNGGNDTLYGGTGEDKFIFDAPTDAMDTIIDFSVADDTIQLDNAGFTKLIDGALAAGHFRIGSSAADSDDYLIYNSGTGQLYYDADGNGSGQQILIANLSANLQLDSGDFFVL